MSQYLYDFYMQMFPRCIMNMLHSANVEKKRLKHDQQATDSLKLTNQSMSVCLFVGVSARMCLL